MKPKAGKSGLDAKIGVWRHLLVKMSWKKEWGRGRLGKHNGSGSGFCIK